MTSSSSMRPTGTTLNGSLGTVAKVGYLANGATLPVNGVVPDEKVTGMVILDVPGTTDTLVVHSWARRPGSTRVHF